MFQKKIDYDKTLTFLPTAFNLLVDFFKFKYLNLFFIYKL